MEPFDFVEAEQELKGIALAFFIGGMVGSALTVLIAWVISTG